MSVPALPSNLPDISRAKLPATYAAAQKALSECSRIDECLEWANKAEALASYAKQAEDDRLRKWAERIQARAIRRCGELLNQIEPSKGGRPSKNAGEARPSLDGWTPGSGAADPSLDGWIPSSRKEAAESAGMTEHRRKTALRVANVPEPEFNEAVESDEPPTVTQLAERGTKRRVVDLGETNPADFARATQALGRLREFAKFAAETDVESIATGMRPNERARVKRDIQTIDHWLDQLITRI